VEHPLTTAPQNHLLTNAAVWSPDSRWIVYDIRSDRDGALFDGDRIEQINVGTGEVQTLYQSRNGAKCGVVTYSPNEFKIVFILGPEHPTADWQYSPSRRQGVVVDTAHPLIATPLEARNLIEPYTPGALRGGSHVHMFASDGWVSFTYNDDITRKDQRNVGIGIPNWAVTVPPDHPRNHDGDYFSVLVTQTVPSPRPGSDEIRRAFEDAWVGSNGYLRPDGTRQKQAIAFQGEVITNEGQAISEVFIVDLPDDPTLPSEYPLQGTKTRLPAPPRGTRQRRLTFTAGRKYPGLAGPRHWLRSSPDGSQIAFLMCDDHGIVQVWTISPLGGNPEQLTHNPTSIASAFTWSPDGRYITYITDGSVFITNAKTSQSRRNTGRTPPNQPLLPHACVFSPDGKKVAYLRRVDEKNQIFVASVENC
jgi:hypothetical protein